MYVRLYELNICQNANVLVTAHIMFSISLLGVGSPYMEHYFQVHTSKDIAWMMMRVEDSFCLSCLYYMYIKPRVCFVLS